MGKDVSNEIVEFSGLEDTEISLITKDAVVKRIRKAKAEVVEKVHTDVTEELDVVTEEDLPQKKTGNIPEWPDGILDYLDETERNKVLEYACNLQISQSTRLHKMLVQYKKDIADYKSKLKEVQSRPYYNSRHNKPENEPEFFKEMSDECMLRAIAILDTIFKTIESLGGSINSDLSVKIRGDIVRFCMVESQDQVKHEMTKQEAQALVKYNDDIKNHRWASKSQIRKYDKVYNGKLRIVFGARSYIRDNDSEKLEDRLGDILVTLYEKAEENRIVREACEETERKRVEEERRREENRQRKEQEIRLVKELVNKAEDYRIAKEIREYIQAMIDSGNEDITPEWIEWALKKADWYDPSIATEDEYLGKRQHEKSAEEEYMKQSEPNKRDKGYAWHTAIGLQAVDGLKTSKYLIDTAIKNIEGDISIDEAQELLNTYYEENPKADIEDRTEEADKVAVRIAKILSEKAFSFTPNEYISIHKKLFTGIYGHAGKLRDYNITKKEWVLNGAIELAENFNIPRSEGAKQPQCPKEKEEAIIGALKAFQMI